MKLSRGRLFPFLALVAMLQSCSMVSKTPKAFYIHYLTPAADSGTQRIWKSEYYFYNKSSALNYDKAIVRNKDSVLEDISFSLGSGETSSHSFSASLYYMDRVPHLSQSMRYPGIAENVFVHNHDSTAMPKRIELLDFNYFYADTLHGISYAFEHESEGSYVSTSEVSISHESESISFDRILELSPEVIDFFRQAIIDLGDSIDLTTIPPMTDLSACPLKESRFSLIQNVSGPDGNKKAIYIDSVLVEGKYEVSQREERYFLLEENDPKEGYKFKRYNANHYVERHVLPNEVSPYYELIYDLSPDGKDTTYKSELTVSKDGRLYCYKIIEQGHFSQKSGPKDRRQPIVKREMYFWFNPRKSRMVRKRYVAYTDKGHRLEKEWLPSKNYKVITNLDTIPELSGSQKYDLVPKDAHEPSYPYFNSLSNKKHKSSGKSPHDEHKQMIKNLRKHTELLEKDRKAGYEKRISMERQEVYEIFEREN